MNSIRKVAKNIIFLLIVKKVHKRNHFKIANYISLKKMFKKNSKDCKNNNW